MPLVSPPSPRLCRERLRAFTLVELLAVIAIIGVLAGLLIPVVGKVRQNARASVCLGNLRQIGAAFQLYAADNRGLYPALRHYNDSQQKNPSGSGWVVEINPYLAAREVTGNIKTNLGTESDAYAYCPEYVHLHRNHPNWNSLQTGGYGMNRYVVRNIAGLNPLNDRFRASLINQPAKTILAGDSTDYHITISANATSWPAKTETRPGGYSSGDPDRHGTNANYLFADGRVVSLTPDEALDTLTRTY